MIEKETKANGVDTLNTELSVEKNAFFGKENPGLEVLKIPEGVVQIGDYAFARCNIQKIILPDTVVRIGKGAFLESKIKHIILSKTIEEICEDAFSGCTDLEMIENVEYIKQIDNGAFRGCASLKEFDGKSLQRIGESAFEESGLEKIDLQGSNLLIIEKKTFKDCKNLLFARLPDSVETIERKAFFSCDNLSAVYFPQKLKLIEEYAFYGCSNNLNDLFFSDEKLVIKHKAFGNCIMLKEVYLNEDTDLDDDVFSKSEGEKVRLVTAPWGSIKEYAEMHPNDVVFIDLMEFEELDDDKQNLC